MQCLLRPSTGEVGGLPLLVLEARPVRSVVTDRGPVALVGVAEAIDDGGAPRRGWTFGITAPTAAGLPGRAIALADSALAAVPPPAPLEMPNDGLRPAVLSFVGDIIRPWPPPLRTDASLTL